MFAPKSNTSTPQKPNSSSIFGGKEDGFIQPKLSVGKAGDKYEQEADKAADQIVAKSKESPSSFIAPSPNIQKQSEEDIQKQESENEIQQKPVVDKITPGVQLKENPIQKQSEEEVQTKEDEEIQEKEEDENVLQKQGGSDGGDTSGLESSLSSSKGGGSPLGSETKNEMESGFGTDFSGVRVHNDSNAIQMNQQLGSQAFANGNDIYFNEGKYSPESDSGKHLLAHELTHTVQQGASVQPKMIQKSNGNTTTAPASNFDPDNFSFSFKGLTFNINITPGGDTIRIDKFPIGAYKVPIHNRVRPFTRTKNYRRDSSEENNNQRETWMNALSQTTAITNFVTQRVLTEHRENPRDSKVYVFRVPGGRGRNRRRIIGNPQAIHRELTLPSWRDNGSSRWFHVDHMQELQLGGQNDINNMNLLNEQSNRSYGFSIYRTIRSIAKEIADHEKSTNNPNPRRANLGNADIVMQNWNLQFGQAVRDPQSQAGANPSHWDYSQIHAGEHLTATNDIHLENIEDLGDESKVFIFPFENGGVGKKFNNNTSVIRNERNWLNPWLITSKTFNTDPGTENTANLGQFQMELKANDVAAATDQTPVAINRYRGARYAGYLDVNRYFLSQYNWGNYRIKKFSPVTFERAIMDPQRGLVIQGKVNPTLSLIEGAALDMEISEGDIKISKIFNTGSFNFPSPFEIKDSSLELFVSIQQGVGIEGRIDFGINNVGEGHIGAAASTSGGFELDGEFNFDSDLFDPAKINVEYKDNIWTIGGEVGIPEGKVRGIKNATINATYSENNFNASGEAELDIPGIERGSMQVNYGEGGFSIEGDFNLSPDIPSIRSGSVSARIAKQEGQENYDVMVSGTARPDIPGINSELTVTYENGALTIEGRAAYSRGMLSGTVEIGATNRTIGDDGQPNGEPDDTMRVYGGGSLTLTLTPWLQATAAVKFLPNGEIEVTGRIGLPDTVDIFARQSIDRTLFNMPALEIPIFAIPLGPRSIGIVARITGGLDFSAGFGPGQIRSLFAEVNYNPDREDETTITGQGQFAIPADAGLKLRGDLGLGVSVGIASLTGGIEVTGELGLEGEALAQVDVNWSPTTGLAIDALGKITVNPKFTFDLNAFARASLDLWVTSISETWRYNLASFSWGPGIEFGIEFPVHYQEGEAFDMSFDDIKVIYPDMDIGNMLKGIARDKKDDIF